MKKLHKKLFQKHHLTLLLGIIIGLVLTVGGVYAAVTIAASNVTYSNTSSGLSATNVQAAIDELEPKADIRKAEKFVAAYTYNSSTCVTGEESTCKKTTCYKTKTSGSCPAGTIIKYKVNDTDIVNFHVMFDKGSTMVMQSQRNTVYSTLWITKEDFVKAGGTETDYGTSGRATKGPLTILPILESVTAGWKNVNDQTYTLGTTTLYSNAYTGCSAYNTCTTNTYTLPSRTAKARMITVQEANALGCTTTNKSCPNWMNNYLGASGYGITVTDKNTANGESYNFGYWTMNASSKYTNAVYYIYYPGHLFNSNITNGGNGARAVVVVSK